MIRRTIAAALCFAVITVSLSGCSFPFFRRPQAATPLPTNEIRIGVSQPLTGPMAIGGETAWEGIELANALSPTVLGKKVRLILLDNKSDKTETAATVTRLATQEKVSAIIGSYGSSLAIEAAKAAATAGIPLIADSASNPAVTQGSDFAFRIGFTDRLQGLVMARYAFDTLAARTVGIITDIDQEYSTGLAAAFKEEFTRLAGTAAVVAESNYRTGAQDFSNELAPLVAAAPDIIFAPGNYGESALLIKQARTAGFRRPILGGDTWDVPQFLTIAGADAQGISFCSQFAADAPQTQGSATFLAEYGKRYVGKAPVAGTALAYDAYTVLLDAISRAGSDDPRAIQAALAKTDGLGGATGTIGFTGGRDPAKPAIIKQIKAGKVTTVAVIPAGTVR